MFCFYRHFPFSFIPEALANENPHFLRSWQRKAIPGNMKLSPDLCRAGTSTYIHAFFFPEGCSVMDVIKAFEEASGQKINYVLCDRRPGDVPSSYATCDLVDKELGWKAKKTLLDMCKIQIHKLISITSSELNLMNCFTSPFSGKDMWTWQSKNPQGYRKEAPKN